MHELTQQEGWKGRAYTLQSLVDGSIEYVTHCVCKDGRILWTCSFVYEMAGAREIRRGMDNMKSMRRFSPPQKFLSDFQEILVPLKFSGPCNIDYKLSAAGDVCVLEINPRFGGSLFPPDVVVRLKGALTCIVDNAIAPQEVLETHRVRTADGAVTHMLLDRIFAHARASLQDSDRIAWWTYSLGFSSSNSARLSSRLSFFRRFPTRRNVPRRTKRIWPKTGNCRASASSLRCARRSRPRRRPPVRPCRHR